MASVRYLVLLLLLLLTTVRASAGLIGKTSTNVNHTRLPPPTVDSPFVATDADGIRYAPPAHEFGSLPPVNLGHSALPDSPWLFLADSNGKRDIPAAELVFRSQIDLTRFDTSQAHVANLRIASDDGFVSVTVKGRIFFSWAPPRKAEEFESLVDEDKAGLVASRVGPNAVDFPIRDTGLAFRNDASPAAFVAQATEELVIPEPSSVALLLGGLALGSVVLLGLSALGIVGYGLHRRAQLHMSEATRPLSLLPMVGQSPAAQASRAASEGGVSTAAQADLAAPGSAKPRTATDLLLEATPPPGAPDFRDVDPRDLRVPPSRRKGADPGKLTRQISLFGSSAIGMPPPWVYEGSDGVLVLHNGVTRAIRIAKLAPGTLIRVEVTGKLPGAFASDPRIGDLLA